MRDDVRLGLLLFACALVLPGCEVPPATPSDSIVVPYQFNLEFSIEADSDADYTARARLYDIAQAYDITGNAGTIELSEGDAVFADDVELDIETKTTFVNTLRVDYSEAIAMGKDAYKFELRRPEEERIEATIPIPQPFEVDDIGEVDREAVRPGLDLTWSPVIEGSTIDIAILPIDDGCLTVVGGGPGDVVKGLDDTGTYRFDTNLYHSIDHDCTYDLIFTRRTVTTVPGRWFKDGEQLPANDVYAIGLRTVHKNFVALQR